MKKRDMVEFNASEEDFQKLYETLNSEDAETENAEDNGKSVSKEGNDAYTDSDDGKKSVMQKSVVMYLHDVVYLLAVVILVFTLLFRIVVVSGTSMNNTLLDGDFLLLLSNTFYKDPKPGDIIVASKDSFDNGAPIVKRVIATENQIVDIDFQNGIVKVDGVVLDEPYIASKTTMPEGVTFPLRVEEGCVFVLGDNRGDSKDSRSPEIGLIDTRQIVGKALFLFLPGTNKGAEERDMGRIGVVS